MQSFITIIPTTQVLAVCQAESFSAAFPTMYLKKNLEIRPQQQPILASQSARDVFEQTEMIHQDVRRNAMQAYIRNKVYYGKNATSLKLKQANYVQVLQPKADHQGSKIPSPKFRWIGPYTIEKVLPNNITQNWHQQDASASSDENALVHTPSTTS